MKRILTIILIIVISSCNSQTTIFKDEVQKMEKINEILSDQVKCKNTPSIQSIHFNKDSILHVFREGFADIKKNRELNSSITYNAFSVTKTFTSLAILQLFEKGLIDINRPIIQYYSEFPYGDEITIKQILSHSAGIPNPIPLDWIHLEKEHNDFDRNSFFHKIFDKNKKVKFEPNEKYSYSNLGYVILGQLIEEVTGLTYEEYINENIIRKLQLDTNDLSFKIKDVESHAIGYHKKLSFTNLLLGFFIDKSKFMGESVNGWKTFNNFYVNGAPYGGLIGTPIGFVNYLQEFLKTDNTLISEKYKQLILQENITNNGNQTGMCLGWFSGELNGIKYFAHAGGGGGYYCELRIYPDINKGSVIFFNRTGMSDERFLDEIDKYILTE